MSRDGGRDRGSSRDGGGDRGGSRDDGRSAGGDRQREPEPAQRVSLLIRNLPLECRLEEVRAKFERYGEIRDVYMPRDYYTQRSRGFGFIEFRDTKDAEDAMYALDRSVIGGREVSVVLSKESRKTPRDMIKREEVYRGGDEPPPKSSGGGGSRERSRSRSPRRERSRERSPRRERSRSRSPCRSSKQRKSSRSPARRASRSPPSRRKSYSRSRSPAPRAERAAARSGSRSRSPRA